MVENSFTSTKCECKNTIEINEIRFVGGENDKGFIKIRCNQCNKEMEEYVINPAETSVIDGGVKISHRYKED